MTIVSTCRCPRTAGAARLRRPRVGGILVRSPASASVTLRIFSGGPERDTVIGRRRRSRPLTATAAADGPVGGSQGAGPGARARRPHAPRLPRRSLASQVDDPAHRRRRHRLRLLLLGSPGQAYAASASHLREATRYRQPAHRPGLHDPWRSTAVASGRQHHRQPRHAAARRRAASRRRARRRPASRSRRRRRAPTRAAAPPWPATWSA